ncbi:MAG TPA: pantoate--beta-alanine ligase [Acidimicrobiales bacterium]|jgi:pantoate--beta-alanine ligase|nr:pantoate--beta-alanine ligase [Acidimicrobiales bacterium]
MEVLDRGDQVRKALDGVRAAGRTVGLVATMGSLHEGHASLIRRSRAECDVTAVTIFVNPLQFGDPADLAAYPRDLDHDVAVAADAGAAVVFAPAVDEMYPGGPPAVTVSVAGFDDMEGASRPGHFDGVATVVAKLFNLAGPCRAYFGEKDFQQLGVVRRLATDLSFPVEVVACPTVREPDGLACSSRNARLSPEERGAATVLYRALTTAALSMAAGECNTEFVRRIMVNIVAREPLATLDYAEVRPPWLLIAACFGGVRLIDNCHIEKQEVPA